MFIALPLFPSAIEPASAQRMGGKIQRLIERLPLRCPLRCIALAIEHSDNSFVFAIFLRAVENLRLSQCSD